MAVQLSEPALSAPGPRPRRGRLAGLPATLVPDGWTLASAPGVAFVLLAFVLPMVVVLWQSFTQPGVSNYTAAWDSGMFRRAIVATFEMAAVVTVISLVIAYPYAYAMARGGKALRGFLFAALMVSFWTSLLVRTFAWEILLDDTGLVNKALLNLHLISQPLAMMHTAFSVDVGMVHILAPYLVLALYAQLRAISPDLEQAARGMGARQSAAFWRVTFPLSLPGAVAGSVLVFILALGFYITPAMLGNGIGQYIGQAIVNEVEQLLQTGVGEAMSGLLLALVLILLAVPARFVGLWKILGVARRSQR
jgi:putative spermidine/putrescine transport system permease protein